MYGERFTGAYDAKAERIVLNRFGNTQATLNQIVQIYTGDVVRGGATAR